MKIAIPSTQPSLQGTVEHRLGTAAYMLIVETDDMSFEAIPVPPCHSGHGAGIATVSLAVNKGAKVLLVGHVAPHIASVLRRQSIEVVTGANKTVGEVVADYFKEQSAVVASEPRGQSDGNAPGSWPWVTALSKGGRQFVSLLPRLVGVVLLLGLFRGLVPDRVLLSLFSGQPLQDTLLGGALGGILAGNPVNSYVIGEGLLHSGVGLAGVMAFMLTWVGVGVIQLPAEAAALGWRFALVRNAAAFVTAVGMALLMALCSGRGM